MKYFLCLLLLGCASKTVQVKTSFAGAKASVEVTPNPARVIPPVPAPPPVLKPKPVRLNRPVAIKVVIPTPVIFEAGKARSIPRTWIVDAVTVCRAKRVIVVGSASKEGRASRNDELAFLRAKNARKAMLDSGCPEKNLSIRWGVGGTRSVTLEAK